MPASAVVYFHADKFFAVQASGERSIIARLFGSSLDLPALCSAMLFAAYASLVEKNYVRLKVAAVTPTGPLIFPIPAQWVKLLLEPLSLFHEAQSSLEGMLMERAHGRSLTSETTQRLIAELIDWPFMSGRSSQAEPQTWDRYYAEALTGIVRRSFPGAQPPLTLAQQTEAMLNNFFQQHEQEATYLSHEISLIIHYIASQQDAQLVQRYMLLAPNAENPLNFHPSALYDEEFWRTLARYSRRQI